MPLYGLSERGKPVLVTYNQGHMMFKIHGLNIHRDPNQGPIIGLKKCWLGFKIARYNSDFDLMEYYARGVNKFLRILKKPTVDFDCLKEDFIANKTFSLESEEF